MVEKTFSMWSTLSGYTLKWCGQIRLSNSESSGVSGISDILGTRLLQVLLCLWQISPDDSEISDPYLLLQVSLCICPTEHPFAILENSTLRRDWNFDLCLHQVSLVIQPVDLKLWVSPGFSTQSDCSQMKNLKEQNWPGSSPLALILPCSWILFAIFRCKQFSWNFLAWQRELKWLMLNKIRRVFHSSRVKFPFCQYVSNLVCGVHVACVMNVRKQTC